MAEDSAQLPVLMNQEYRVKLGRSFLFPKENAFHTIKYDFKPKSVDSSKPGRMKVEGEEVAVSLPVVQAESADDVTLFRGSKKPCPKECILIINTQSGEAVLEKISNTVQLKAIRDANPRSKKLRSVSPLPMQSKPSGGKPLISAGHKPLVGGRTSPGKVAKVTKAKRKAKDSLSVTTNKTMAGTAISFRPANPTVSSLQPMSALPESISPIHSNNPTPEPPPVSQLNPDHLVAAVTSKAMRSGSVSSSSKQSLSASSSGASDSESENLMQMLSGHPSGMPQVHATSYPYHKAGHVTHEAGIVPQGVSEPIAIPKPMTVQMPHSRGLSEDSSSSCESESSDGDSGESSSTSGSSSSERALARPPPIMVHHKPSMSQLRDDLAMSDSDECGSQSLLARSAASMIQHRPFMSQLRDDLAMSDSDDESGSL